MESTPGKVEVEQTWTDDDIVTHLKWVGQSNLLEDLKMLRMAGLMRNIFHLGFAWLLSRKKTRESTCELKSKPTQIKQKPVVTFRCSISTEYGLLESPATLEIISEKNGQVRCQLKAS